MKVDLKILVIINHKKIILLSQEQVGYHLLLFLRRY
jgi:hypothetical protein